MYTVYCLYIYEITKKHGVYNKKKVLGVTTLDVIYIYSMLSMY